MKNGELNKRLPDLISKREWKWKSLREKRELSKLEKSRRLPELSTKRELSLKDSKEKKELKR